MNKLKIFGVYRNVIIDLKKNNDKRLFKMSEDKKTITLFSYGYSSVDELIKYVYLQIFSTILNDYVKNTLKEVPKAAINNIVFKKSQKMPIKIDYLNKEKNVTGMTNEICSKCDSFMMLRINKRTGTKFLGCSNYPKCNNIERINQNWKDKSKNGYYLYFGPSIISYSFEIIKAKVIFNLIITYYKMYSKEFMEELNKLCPNYWELHSNEDLIIIKKAIIKANADLSKNEINQIMGYLEVRKDIGHHDK